MLLCEWILQRFAATSPAAAASSSSSFVHSSLHLRSGGGVAGPSSASASSSSFPASAYLYSCPAPSSSSRELLCGGLSNAEALAFIERTTGADGLPVPGRPECGTGPVSSSRSLVHWPHAAPGSAPVPAEQGLGPGSEPAPPCYALGLRHVITLQAADASGSLKCSGGDYFEAQLAGEALRYRPRTVDWGNGSYSFEFELPAEAALEGPVQFSLSASFAAFDGLWASDGPLAAGGAPSSSSQQHSRSSRAFGEAAAFLPPATLLLASAEQCASAPTGSSASSRAGSAAPHSGL
jgi:hypothetical protein